MIIQVLFCTLIKCQKHFLFNVTDNSGDNDTTYACDQIEKWLSSNTLLIQMMNSLFRSCFPVATVSYFVQNSKGINIGGSSGGRARHTPLPPTPRVQILSFQHTKFMKLNCLLSPRPPTRSTSPYGKSWIRH